MFKMGNSINTKKKTIVIGIDGGCWNYIEPLMKRGKLPHIEFLVKNGSAGILKSTIPPITPVAWSTFITGVNPGKHGVFDWLVPTRSNELSPVTGISHNKAPFWHYLNEQGLRVGVINLPMTYPAPKVEGFTISGFDSPINPNYLTYPKSLYARIIKKYGSEIFILPSHNLLTTERGQEKYVIDYIQHENFLTDIALELIEEFAVQFFMINYMINDHFNHLIPSFNFIEDALKCLDKNLGRFLEKHPNANYIVMSDHGSFRSDKVLMVYKWLEQEHFIELNEKKEQAVKVKALLSTIIRQRFGWNGIEEKILKNILKIMIMQLPSGIRRKFIHYFSKDKKRLPFYPHHALDKYKSLILQFSAAGLYLNKNCTVPFLYAPDIRDTVIAKLQRIEDPYTGLLLVKEVLKKEDIYNGPFVNNAPDLIPIQNEEANIYWCGWNVFGIENQDIYTNNENVGFYGGHITDGIFIFYGEDFQVGIESEPLYIPDITATILHLNKILPPPFWDGKPKSIFFKENFLQESLQPLEPREGWKEAEEMIISSREKKKIEETLKGLGYM
jgi:predicted AlkP superfamily phosphohydrolase/phosphomutase